MLLRVLPGTNLTFKTNFLYQKYYPKKLAPKFPKTSILCLFKTLNDHINTFLKPSRKPNNMWYINHRHNSSASKIT
jgi:hypothetical protein